MKTLIIGGAASGKSAYAEGLASNSKLYKIYLASANIYDEEMQLKVNKHKIRRGDDWTTISEPLEAKEKKKSKWRLVLYKDGKKVGGKSKKGKSRLFKKKD